MQVRSPNNVAFSSRHERPPVVQFPGDGSFVHPRKRITLRRASSRESPSLADACEEGSRVAYGRIVDLRAKMGWVSRVGVPGWRGDPDPKPRRKTVKPILSRVARAHQVTVAGSLCARWRDRDREKRRTRLRGAPTPASSRG